MRKGSLCSGDTEYLILMLRYRQSRRCVCNVDGICMKNTCENGIFQEVGRQKILFYNTIFGKGKLHVFLIIFHPTCRLALLLFYKNKTIKTVNFHSICFTSVQAKTVHFFSIIKQCIIKVDKLFCITFFIKYLQNSQTNIGDQL